MGKTKKRFFAKHAKSSAALVSLGIHALIIVVALSFVAFTVMQKEEQVFEAKPVNRPRMQLKKLQVPVNIKKKKVQKPKLRKQIVVKPTVKQVDIQLPEITGVKGGMGGGTGSGLGGLSLGFDFDMDLFGSNRGTGNEFVGTLYDLKQTKGGKPTDIGIDDFYRIIKRFVGSNWNPNRLSDYYQAPKQKHASFFMMPRMSANEAPKAFGVEGLVKPSGWVIHYRGTLCAPEDGKYRFCGMGDNALIVKVGSKKVVLDATLQSRDAGKMTSWKSDDPDNRKFPMEHGKMVIGDWFNLKKGEPVEMDVLVGEAMTGGAETVGSKGNKFSATLLIQQEGKTYPMAGGRPVLPIFKTIEIPEKMIPQMKIKPGQATADGPVFGVESNAK